MLQRIMLIGPNTEIDGGVPGVGCIKDFRFCPGPVKIHLHGRGNPLRLTRDSEIGQVLATSWDESKNELHANISLYGAGAAFFSRTERKPEFRAIGDSEVVSRRIWYAPWRVRKAVLSMKMRAVIMEVNTDEVMNGLRVHSGRNGSHAKRR